MSTNVNLRLQKVSSPSAMRDGTTDDNSPSALSGELFSFEPLRQVLISSPTALSDVATDDNSRNALNDEATDNNYHTALSGEVSSHVRSFGSHEIVDDFLLEHQDRNNDSSLTLQPIQIALCSTSKKCCVVCNRSLFYGVNCCRCKVKVHRECSFYLTTSPNDMGFV